MNPLFRDAPAHWRTVRLKQTVTACRTGTWGEEPRGGTGDVVCVRVADFDRARLGVTLDNATMRFVPPSLRSGRMLARGDLLLEKSGGGDLQPVGAVVLYDHDVPAVSSNFIARMPVAPGFDPRYLCYLHAALHQLGLNCRSILQTTGIQNLDSDAYLSETVRIPDLEEQRRIAWILDKKSELLDALTRGKQKLVELLHEKRRAIISRAVIEGLDPDAPRRHSGVEWLGAIPAHWCATRFKFVRSGALLYGANLPAVCQDRDAPRYIRITDLRDDGTLRGDTFESLPAHRARPYLLRDGDVLLARSGATVGKAFRYRSEWGPACFAGYLVRLRPDPRKILPDYLSYYTQTHAFRQEVRLSTVQATIANVSASRYANFAIPLPPIEEQRAIGEFLDRRTRILHRLVFNIERQIEELGECRGTLIAAMVTRGSLISAV